MLVLVLMEEGWWVSGHEVGQWVRGVLVTRITVRVGFRVRVLVRVNWVVLGTNPNPTTNPNPDRLCLREVL